MEKEIKCCEPNCENKLDQQYWDIQYQNKKTGWDLGEASPPLKTIIDRIENNNVSILIPGAGNAYEADYLLSKGFNNVTIIDIAPTVVAVLKEKYQENKNIKIILGNFFDLNEKFDIILEQTFFCALNPSLRMSYVAKMHQLLNKEGFLTGLLFNRTFEQGPPFGGNMEEYQKLFSPYFDIEELEICLNSITPRANSELMFRFCKK